MRLRHLAAAAPALLPLLCAFIACSDSTGPSANAAGVYTLRLVNGQAPPAMYNVTADFYRILTATRTLRSDGTWSETETRAQTTSKTSSYS